MSFSCLNTSVAFHCIENKIQIPFHDLKETNSSYFSKFIMCLSLLRSWYSATQVLAFISSNTSKYFQAHDLDKYCSPGLEYSLSFFTQLPHSHSPSLKRTFLTDFSVQQYSQSLYSVAYVHVAYHNFGSFVNYLFISGLLQVKLWSPQSQEHLSPVLSHTYQVWYSGWHSTNMCPWMNVSENNDSNSGVVTDSDFGQSPSPF